MIADVPYSNKKLASMDMEERYRLIISTILNAIGLKVEVEKMNATGRIDMIVQTSRYIYVLELKLRNNGGKEAAFQQILSRQYMEPFKADKRQVIGLGIELDEDGKGLLDWKKAESTIMDAFRQYFLLPLSFLPKQGMPSGQCGAFSFTR